MKRKSRQFGMTLVQTVAVLSILLTLSAIATPSVARVRREVYVTQCTAQLNGISLALKQYRDEHHGKYPGNVVELFPRYVNAEQLICPLILTNGPEVVASRIAEAKRLGKPGHAWSTYFGFNHRIIDRLGPQTNGRSYTDVLKDRGMDTPIVVCHDHREPRSLNPFLGRPRNVNHARIGDSLTSLAELPHWEYPDEPALVIRYDGRVTKSWTGGFKSRGIGTGTAYELENL